MKEFWTKNKKNAWFWAFIIVAAALLFIMPILSLDAGNTGDEDGFQIPQGQNVVNYYKTHGEDTTCLNFKDNLQYYGSSFDVITEYINQTFHIKDINISRHICNSLLGWLAILMVGLIAYQLGGFRAGAIAMILLFLSPRFLGHSFNNPKDLPFATAVISAIFGMVLFFKQFPKVKWYTFVILILSIAFSISVRIGGLILFGYFGLLGLIYLFFHLSNKKKNGNKLQGNGSADTYHITLKDFFKLLVMGLLICIVGYFAGLLLWPFALQAPIKNPMEAFKLMSSFDISLRQLFEGTMQWSDRLPWYYTPKYILISIPIAVIIGMILFFIFCWRKKEDRFWAFFVFFTFFFPVFWIVYTRANVYGGWRHAMFAYPPMVVAAGWGFDGLVRWVESKLGINNETTTNNDDTDVARHVSTKGIIVNVASVVILLALLIGPIRHIVANHPYEYVYFNEFAGGAKKAFGNYEMDYYYHSTREASEWIIANAEPKADGSKIRVGTWHTASVNYFFRNDTARFQPTFIRWYEKENSDWDYAIFTVTGINPEYLRSPKFPPKNTVKTIEVDGKPICIILKRNDKSDCQAFKYKNEGRLDSAFILYKQALQKDPENLGALLNIGELYVRINRPDSALMFLNRYTAIDPYAEVANYMTAYAHIYKGENDKALDIVRKIQKHNIKYTGAYYLAIQIYLQKKDFVAANKEFMKLIDIDRVDDQFVQMWLQFNQMQNIDAQHAYIKLYKAMAKSFEKRGKKKEAEQYQKLATGR
jgi:hypothetical protein